VHHLIPQVLELQRELEERDAVLTSLQQHCNHLKERLALAVREKVEALLLAAAAESKLGRRGAAEGGGGEPDAEEDAPAFGGTVAAAIERHESTAGGGATGGGAWLASAGPKRVDGPNGKGPDQSITKQPSTPKVVGGAAGAAAGAGTPRGAKPVRVYLTSR
jgi:hypothetical protein